MWLEESETECARAVTRFEQSGIGSRAADRSRGLSSGSSSGGLAHGREREEAREGATMRGLFCERNGASTCARGTFLAHVSLFARRQRLIPCKRHDLPNRPGQISLSRSRSPLAPLRSQTIIVCLFVYTSLFHQIHPLTFFSPTRY